jgi:hypothetical protein
MPKRLLSRALLLAGLAPGLAACASPGEIREARIERDRAVCEELGFEIGSEGFVLCVLIQDTNRRIDQVHQRLQFLESDLRWIDRFDRPFYRHR